MIEIHGNNQFAIMTADFAVIRTRLQENTMWGADILQLSGEFEWRVKAARLYSQGFFGARVIDETPDSLIAWGISGNKGCFAYKVERLDALRIQITPLAYLERRRKIGLGVILALMFVLPVLLSPILWKLYEIQTLRSSRIYLHAFARYLVL